MKKEPKQKMTTRTGPFIRSSDAVLRHIAGEHLLVPFRRDQTLNVESVYILDDVGAWVWEALSEAMTLEALEAGIQDAFDVPEEQDVIGDLRELFDDLVGQGLVVIGDEP